MAGRDLEETKFRRLTNCIVLGIKRNTRIIREQITNIVLEEGDVLLIQGSKRSIEKNIQPLFADLAAGGFACAHNGNLINAMEIRKELIAKGAIF